MNKLLRILSLILLLASALQLRAQEEFAPEFESVVFVPKGQWIVGASINYTQSNQSDYQFLIVEGISGDTYSFKVSPLVGYAVRDDLVLGGRFSYNRSLTKLESADIVLDSETSTDIDHLYNLSHDYYGIAVMRNYFSIGKSKRFGFFNEIQLQLGGGQSIMKNGVGDNLSGIYARNFKVGIGLAPGLALFLNNYSAMEVNIGVLGFNYTHTRQVSDRVYVAHLKSKKANFKINLFSISFGMAFYL